MNNFLTGKGFYTWVLTLTEGGDPDKIAQVASDAGLSHVLIKVANGKYDYNISADIAGIVMALRLKGIAVWGWHYVYLYYPAAEAAKAVERVEMFDLDGYVIDAEVECKGRNAYVAPFMNGLTPLNVPIALSSYRYPSYHPTFPWVEFLKRVDLVMPQVYWLDAYNPAEQLEKSYNEYHGIAPHLPFIPTGAAWKQGDWQVRPQDALEFLAKAEELGLSAANFWDWQHCRGSLPQTWDAISKYEWAGETPPPPPEPDMNIQLRVTANQLRVHTKPAYSSVCTAPNLTKGALVTVKNVIPEWEGVWIEHDSGYSAAYYNGVQYMERVT